MKLATWAEFECRQYTMALSMPSKDFCYPGTRRYRLHGDLPNFSQSLDACFKWLVPKLYENDYVLIITDYFKEPNEWVVELVAFGKNTKNIIEVDKEPALALCLAMEKLIKFKVI